MEPGTANTSRPKSLAMCAVISEPEASDASTTKVPTDSPAMMRLRFGKLPLAGAVPSANSDSNKPCSPMRCASAWWARGYTRSKPVPTTAMVGEMPFVVTSNAPSCAAPSMPCAKPDTMHSPAWLKLCAKSCAVRTPCALALRLPTMAKAACGCSSWRLPQAYISIGGSSMSPNKTG